jgi:hypothetical protein
MTRPSLLVHRPAFYMDLFPPPPPTMAQQPLVGQGVLIIESSLSHSDTPHSVGLLWTDDQPDAKTSTSQHTTLRQTSMLPARFEPTIPASERPQTHALDRAITKIAFVLSYPVYFNSYPDHRTSLLNEQFAVPIPLPSAITV